MEKLGYNVLRGIGYDGYLLEDAPVRVLQFGEGNFMRAFVDYFIDVANEKCGFNGKVTVVQPIANGLADLINAQEGLYTLYLRGSENSQKVSAKRVISCIKDAINPYTEYEKLLNQAKNPDLRYIASNTTEAGIAYDADCNFDDAPPAAFPAKLTRFLYERYLHFGKIPGKGLVILSCELIDHNGEELRKCVEKYTAQWKLDSEFSAWLSAEVLFCSTLVDRIVTGYPRNEADALNTENGYTDNLLDTGEIFGLWVIEGPEWLEKELPFAKAGLPVKVVRDHTPYKQQKVRILNGAHTSMIMAAYLSGYDIVRDCMEDDTILNYMKKSIYDEIIPTLSLPEEEVKSFAAAVEGRFKNPFIDHSLLAIALNSTSKWKARVLPSVKIYLEKFGKLPSRLTFSFAAYLAFYRRGILTDTGLCVKRGEQEYIVNDDLSVLNFFAEHAADNNEKLAKSACESSVLWSEENLSALTGFSDAVKANLDKIDEVGMKKALEALN